MTYLDNVNGVNEGHRNNSRSTSHTNLGEEARWGCGSSSERGPLRVHGDVVGGGPQVAIFVMFAIVFCPSSVFATS